MADVPDVVFSDLVYGGHFSYKFHAWNFEILSITNAFHTRLSHRSLIQGELTSALKSIIPAIWCSGFATKLNNFGYEDISFCKTTI
jgi:hypothetical protein